jgi:hypothetical protein
VSGRKGVVQGGSVASSSKKKARKKAGTSRRAKVGGRKAAAQQSSSIKLSVRGFKSLRDRVEVELRPLTLLSGRNSSGKSSLMQPLLLLKQTLEAPFDYGPLRLDGPNVHFSEAQQLFWRGRTQKDRATKFGVAIGKGSFGKGSFREYAVYRVKKAGLYGLVHEKGLASIRRIVDRLFHVPGLRGNPTRHYPVTAVGERFPGPFPPYTASVLAHWAARRDERLPIVAEQLRDLGLTWKVESRRLDDTRLELRVARTYEPQRGGAKDLVNVADVGFGVSQVLPVLVALLAAKKGDIVHIEQPEIHLHPAAQARLARPLAAAAKRGVIVVAETHSPLLLRSIQQLVADGSLPARDVGLHWFRRDDSGATQVTTAELGPDGSYGNWPEDFEEAELDVEARLLAAMAGQ